MSARFRIGMSADDARLAAAKQRLGRTRVEFESAEGLFDFPLDVKLDATRWAADQRITLGTIHRCIWTMNDGSMLTFDRAPAGSGTRQWFRLTRIARPRPVGSEVGS